MLVQDAVIVTTEVLAGELRFLHSSQPPPEARFNLADDLWVGKLDDETAKNILDSCEPTGRWVKKPVKLFSQLYAFVREPASEEPLYTWDSDLRLQFCIALSRLIHPTSISFEHAARITYESDGSVREIIPGPVKGFGSEAYVANENSRNWLITDDLQALREILKQTRLSNLPPRVHRALWYHEFAARTREVSVRWTLVCTALEALVHTDRLHSTKQFKKRVPQLAKELGTCQFSEDDAETAYDLRSRVSHGQGLASLKAQDRNLYERMENVLRHTLVHTIHHPEFAQAFESDQTIQTRWPKG